VVGVGIACTWSEDTVLSEGVRAGLASILPE